MTTPRIETIGEKKLIGQRVKMSLANNRTGELWRGFMPRRREIRNNLTAEQISMRVYNQTPDFSNFNPLLEFDKWAAMEVSDVNTIPAGMEGFTLTGGLYAVFPYEGLNTDDAIFRYIYMKWVPASGYVLDNRPHFEILGDRYKNNDPDSEEEIWIPIKPKE